MSKWIKYSVLILCIISFSDLFSQNKETLKREIKQLEQEIKNTNKKLEKEKNKKNSALKQLKLSNKKINQHKNLLTNLETSIIVQNSSIKNVEKNIDITMQNIIKKEEELKSSKEVYAKLIYQTYIWKNTYNETYFLISSDDLNQIFKRKQYLNQLTTHRKNHINKINRISNELISENNSLILKKKLLLEEREKKKILFSQQKDQYKNLKIEKNRNSEIVSNIKKNENFYKLKLEGKKKQAQEIEEKIKKIIEEEIRKAREYAENNNTGTPLTPESMKLSSNFESNKGLLPWPLEKGVISEKYGIQKSKHISGIETKNNGINFETEKGQTVRVVFDGVVSRIFFIKGKGKAILVMHGNYFTVYSGLKDVVVKTGEKVFSKQKIGSVATTEVGDDTELHFELWHGKEPQNPVKWLYKAK